VPDLFVPAWSLWIEMKRQKGGRLSADQKDWIAYLESIGHVVIVGRGFEDARAQIESMMRRDER
jgi:VRR-NUC domain.